ncbi:prolactin receptor, partial [Clarias magur]
SEKVNECPDYKTAGPNSCFFNKSDTSLWVDYNITVVATNSRGASVSEPVVVDVANI